MSETILTENEERVLILILLSEGSATEKGVKRVLDWNDELLSEQLYKATKQRLFNAEKLQHKRLGC